MDPLTVFLAACVALYVLTVKGTDTVLDVLAARRACTHTTTEWHTTPEGGIRVDCLSCGEYVGTHLHVMASA